MGAKEVIIIMQENKRVVVEGITTKLLTNIQPKSIVLFGSVANGTASLDSDIDLLVIWDEAKDIPNMKRRLMLRQIIGIVESPLDLLTCTSDELRIALNDENSFTSHIVKEGEVLYGGLN
jgi:predicted nucleotidyltransferase